MDSVSLVFNEKERPRNSNLQLGKNLHHLTEWSYKMVNFITMTTRRLTVLWKKKRWHHQKVGILRSNARQTSHHQQQRRKDIKKAIQKDGLEAQATRKEIFKTEKENRRDEQRLKDLSRSRPSMYSICLWNLATTHIEHGVWRKNREAHNAARRFSRLEGYLWFFLLVWW